MNDNQPATIAPRVLREREAADYLSLSASYLRNTRARDMRKQTKGEGIEGPAWINIGGAVRYVRDDLDAWIEYHRKAA